jgi:DNA modification methylase
MIVNHIFKGDNLNNLKTMPDSSVDCCVTSPPYFGLRDYRKDHQIGLEETPEEYVKKLLAVFIEVKRILKNDGTLWVIIGDVYAGSNKGGAKYPENAGNYKKGTNRGLIGQSNVNNVSWGECKNKDLVGIPWMFAFALRADGWYLRQDIIWHKPNPMPESVTDRCTKSHEYIFLLSKSKKYYFDNNAIKETAVNSGHICRNKRDVWTVAVKPNSHAHYAAYPEKLITPCILSSCPENGIVLDPFIGSGTTAVAAIKNNRKYIGCEINPEYIKIAEQRIAENKRLINKGCKHDQNRRQKRCDGQQPQNFKSSRSVA